MYPIRRAANARQMSVLTCLTYLRTQVFTSSLPSARRKAPLATAVTPMPKVCEPISQLSMRIRVHQTSACVVCVLLGLSDNTTWLHAACNHVFSNQHGCMHGSACETGLLVHDRDMRALARARARTHTHAHTHAHIRRRCRRRRYTKRWGGEF